MSTITIFNVQKCCLDDGPGIRTTIFFKGCNLKCKWCHNPESLSSSIDLIVNKSTCANCQKCASLCNQNAHTFDGVRHIISNSYCIKCGNCVNGCTNESLSFNGYKIEINEIFSQIIKDKKYYDSSGGGVTFSGGEATMQLDGLLKLTNLCKEVGIHTTLETNGNFNKDTAYRLLKKIDLFLIDFKLGNNEKHIKYTKLDNEKIKTSINYLSRNGANIILRCPIIPSINDNDEHFMEIANMVLENKGIKKFEILPYHNLATEKWNNNNIEYECNDIEVPRYEKVIEWTMRVNYFINNNDK